MDALKSYKVNVISANKNYDLVDYEVDILLQTKHCEKPTKSQRTNCSYMITDTQHFMALLQYIGRSF